MPQSIDLTGEWKQFSISNGKITIHRQPKVFITHKKQNLISVQEESSNWSNIGQSRNVGGIGSTFDITWDDRFDSNGNGLKTSHQYKVKILSNNILIQILTSNNEKAFSFGNWCRVNKTNLEKELIQIAKNGDSELNELLREIGFDINKQ